MTVNYKKLEPKNNRFHVCCSVMRNMMRKGDETFS